MFERFKILVAVAAVFLCAQVNAIELYVKPDAPEPVAGKPQIFFKSLEAARDAIRGLKQNGALPPGEVTVWVEMPNSRTEPFELDERDSGSAESPIVYRRQGKAMPCIIGAKYLSEDTDFKRVTDEQPLMRLPEDARQWVFEVDLLAAGVTDLGTFPDGFESAPLVSEVFTGGGKRMRLARWPNEGWATISKVIESGPAPWRNHQSDAMGTFEYEGDRPARWQSAPAVWLQGYWCFDWAIETIRVGAIDTEKKQITLAKQHHYGLGSGNPAPRRFAAINLLEELDERGEYFIDRESNKLYVIPYMPDEGVEISTVKEPLIHLKGASHITIRDFRIEMCAGTGIKIEGGSHITIAGCQVRSTGQAGIVVEGGSNHTIEACDIFDIGTTGISINGGDRKTLTPSFHRVINNHIHNVSQRQKTHAYNLLLGGVGIHVAHNSIHDAPHQAITIGGNDHLIEYNEIYRIGMESDDCGAFYMGRNPSERGTILRYNYWHDLGSEMAHGSCAIYFDDGAGGQQVYGNVFYRAAGGGFGAVFSHGGHDNIVENNIFIECKRAMGASPWPEAYWNQWLSEPLWQERLLKEVDITKPPYTERYPDLNNFMESGKEPRVNRANRNVIVKCESSTNGNWLVKDSLVYSTDPGFADFDKQNFALRDDAVVYKVLPEFESIPFDQIGLQQTELRPELPKKE